MKYIPMICTGLLLTTVFTLHLTAPQKHIVYLPAQDTPIKVRPNNLSNPIPQVISLEEADRRYNETYGIPVADDYEIDDTKWILSILEVQLWKVKRNVIDFFVG